MAELKERFALADEIGPPELWGEVKRRAAAPEAPPRAVDWPPATGRRLIAAAVALAVFAAAAIYAWDLSHPDGPGDPSPRPGVHSDPPPPIGEPTLFIPEGAERDGEATRLPVVFPDGTEATLTYPSELDLGSMGIQPDVSYLWSDDPGPRFPIVFLHHPIASIADYVEGPEPVGSVSSYSDIEIWKMSEAWLERRVQLQGAWLRVGLPSWTILVALPEVADADVVAANLDVRETTSGFPVVDATGPLGLADGLGEAEGAQLAFGDGAAEPDTVSQLDATIFLGPADCQPGWSETSGGFGSACLGGGAMWANIYGDRDFVTSVIEGLRVEGVVSAPATTCIEPSGSTDRKRARSVAETFLSMRVQGVSVEELGRIMTSSAIAHWIEPDESPGPLLGDYGGHEIVFIDGPSAAVPDGEPIAFEIGIRLRVGDRSEVTETLFVSPGTNASGDPCLFVVDGGRSGLDGP